MVQNVKKLLVALSLVVLPAGVAAQQTVTRPLVIVDGVVVGTDSVATQVINRLAPSDILSIDVIKGAVAAELYGTRGSGGVIIIRTKAGPDDAPLTEQQREWTELLKRLRSIEQPPAATRRPQPLIVVDGVVIGRGEPAGLDALKDRIESISVLKGAAAMAAYGLAAADGVIVIITK